MLDCIVLYCINFYSLLIFIRCLTLATKSHLSSFLNSMITVQGPPDDGLTVGFPAGWKRDDALQLSLLQVGADIDSSSCIHAVISSLSAALCVCDACVIRRPIPTFP